MRLAVLSILGTVISTVIVIRGAVLAAGLSELPEEFLRIPVDSENSDVLSLLEPGKLSDEKKDIEDGIVKYRLYTRENIDKPQQSITNDALLFNSLEVQKPLKILIHGWRGHEKSEFNVQFINGYLPEFDYTVITVDWSGMGSLSPLYPVARRKVPEVAERVTGFLERLRDRHGVRIDDLHIIGHSLGAHIAGIVGTVGFNGTIGRISGMDPAGPYFRMEDAEGRLSRRSARFVDVIHTASDFLGCGPPIGHVDFYPNGGHVTQPGCGPDFYGMCSHQRCINLYIESIADPRSFPAVSCEDWAHFKSHECNATDTVVMGEGTPPQARGVYYLATNSESPFGKEAVWR